MRAILGLRGPKAFNEDISPYRPSSCAFLVSVYLKQFCLGVPQITTFPCCYFHSAMLVSLLPLRP